MKSSRNRFWVTVLLNLLFGNLILLIFHGKNDTYFFLIKFHAIFSANATISIYVLYKMFQKIQKSILMIMLSSIAAFLVPVLSFFFLFGISAIFEYKFHPLITAIPISLIAGVLAYQFWIPFAIMNFFLLKKYAIHQEQI